MNPKFHLSLDVENMDDSVRFYTVLFDAEPTKCKPGYARFDLERPALNLSIQQKDHCCRKGLNHMGLRMNCLEEVGTIRKRLNAAGYATEDESNITSYDAVQHKFWVRDPSKFRWEVYVFKADAETVDAPAAGKECCC